MSDFYGMEEGDFIDSNVRVDKRSGESEESLIERFMKEVRKSGILEEKKKSMYFTKPSKKRRIAREKAKAKAKEGD